MVKCLVCLSARRGYAPLIGLHRPPRQRGRRPGRGAGAGRAGRRRGCVPPAPRHTPPLARRSGGGTRRLSASGRPGRVPAGQVGRDPCHPVPPRRCGAGKPGAGAAEQRGGIPGRVAAFPVGWRHPGSGGHPGRARRYCLRSGDCPGQRCPGVTGGAPTPLVGRAAFTAQPGARGICHSALSLVGDRAGEAALGLRAGSSRSSQLASPSSLRASGPKPGRVSSGSP